MSKIIKGKTLIEFALANKCKNNTELFKLIKGKKLRTTGTNRSGHSYPSRFVAFDLHPSYGGQTINGNGTMMVSTSKRGTWNPTNFYLSEIELDSVKVSDLKAEADTLLKQSKNIESYIKICTDLKIDEYDEKLVKTIKALAEIKKSKVKDVLKEAKDFLAIIEEE